MSGRRGAMLRIAVVMAMLTGAIVTDGLAAQSRCGVNNPGRRQTRDCTARTTVTMRLPMLATLGLSSATTSLTAGTPSVVFGAAADTGFVVEGPRVLVLANRAVQVTLTNESAFLGPVPKPASDVAIGVAPTGAPCAPVATTPLSVAPPAAQAAAPRVLFATGGATLGTQRQLCLRVWWRASNDAPGSYTLPLEVSITAP